MATPSRSQTVSTPKPHLSTPNRMMASPRPGTSGISSRPLAYKSPAVKTPASVQGHTHGVSVSSQPASTPAAAAALHDDLLALNSPAAALIASIGQTGMTPMPSGGDGLGISTSLQSNSGRGPVAPANPELERVQRAHLVADILKTKVAGHGTTREGVERIAKLQGFTTLWDDENLTIAGNAVDLEVIFDARERDRVTDVSLKLNTSETEEPELQESGSEILKDNLRPLHTVNGPPQWTDLNTFEANLQYLSQLDRIEGGAPCFEAVNGLYDAFQKIWNAEKERFSGRTARQGPSRSAVGRPFIDRKPVLGLGLDYWCTRQDLQEEALNGNGEHHDDPSSHLYTARISCEPGPPSTVLTSRWVSGDVLVPVSQTVGDMEAEKLMPDWQDPAQDAHGLNTSDKTDSGEANGDKPAGSPPTLLDMHFVSCLEPEVYLPLNIAAHLNADLPMVELKQELTVTYQTALQKHFNANHTGSASASQERWPRSLPTLGEKPPRQHSYALHSAQHAAVLWCYPVKQLKFNHPRQLAAVIPVLRQYALLWSVLRSLVDYGVVQQDTVSESAVSPAQARSSSEAGPVKRSNAKTQRSKLDSLLNPDRTVTEIDILPVDLSLDVISDISKAKLDLIVPLSGPPSKMRQSPFVSVSLEFCPGGDIHVPTIRGVQFNDESKLKDKIIRVLTATEDLGLLVEWLLEQARSQP
ncbi:hypothetical protein ABEF95_015345 [Exophiala dermatitidis]